MTVNVQDVPWNFALDALLRANKLGAEVNGNILRVATSETLAKEDIEMEVIDLRSLMPLDREAIAATVKKTNKVIVLHEDVKTGGIAGEIAAIINENCFDDLDGPIVRITALDTPVPFSRPRAIPF